jgi:hypothetical protein
MVAALTLSLAAVPALAADNGFYLGVGVGQAGVADKAAGAASSDDTGYKGDRRLSTIRCLAANHVDLALRMMTTGVPVDRYGRLNAFVVGILRSMIDPARLRLGTRT